MWTLSMSEEGGVPKKSCTSWERDASQTNTYVKARKQSRLTLQHLNALSLSSLSPLFSLTLSLSLSLSQENHPICRNPDETDSPSLDLSSFERAREREREREREEREER